MQKMGKYYWLTAGAYIAELVGTTLVLLTTGSLVHNATGVSLGLLTMSIGNGRLDPQTISTSLLMSVQVLDLRRPW